MAEDTPVVNLGSPPVTSLPPFVWTGPKTTQDVVKDVIKYTPAMAATEYAMISKYGPQQIEDYLRYLQKYGPAELKALASVESQYVDDFTKMAMDAERQARESAMQQVADLTPAVNEVQQAALGEDWAALWDLLLAQSLYDVQAGISLSPEEKRAVEQATRAAQSARGLDYNGATANAEAVERLVAGNALKSQRQQNAMNVLSGYQASKYDPFKVVLGMPTTAASYALQKVNYSGRMPTTFGPLITGIENSMQASDMGIQASTNYANAMNSYNQAAAQFANQSWANQANLALSAAQAADDLDTTFMTGNNTFSGTR